MKIIAIKTIIFRIQMKALLPESLREDCNLFLGKGKGGASCVEPLLVLARWHSCWEEGRVPGPRQDEGEVPEENSPEGSWVVTENKMCFTIFSWH